MSIISGAAQFNMVDVFQPLFVPWRYKAYHGGRGGGKSHGFAQALIVHADQRPGILILCCREIQNSIKDSVKETIEQYIYKMGMRHLFVITLTEIRHVNGSRFIFKGLRSNPESVKSTEGIHICYVEEANTVSKRSLELLIPTVFRQSTSEIWFAWNRRFSDDPVDEMFLGGTPPPNSYIRQVNHNDNPFFPEGLREQMEWDKKRDYEKYLHVWEGGLLIKSEDRIFKNWRIEEFEIPDSATRYQGADWGFTNDPACLVQLASQRAQRKLFIRHEAYKIGCEIEDLPALFAGTDDRNPEKWENRYGERGIPGARKWRIIADSARPEIIAYMRKKGFNMKPAAKGAGSVDEGIKFVQNYDIIVHPDCKNAIYELSHYRYKRDKQTDEILPVPEDKNNHVIDGVRYAVEDVRKKGRFFA